MQKQRSKIPYFGIETAIKSKKGTKKLRPAEDPRAAAQKMVPNCLPRNARPVEFWYQYLKMVPFSFRISAPVAFLDIILVPINVGQVSKLAVNRYQNLFFTVWAQKNRPDMIRAALRVTPNLY